MAAKKKAPAKRGRPVKAASKKAAPKAKATAAKRGRKPKAEAVELFDYNCSVDLAELGEIEKNVGILNTAASHTKRLPTGAYALDLILSGGLVPGGWYTFFGGEQSSKSTLAMTQVAMAAVKKQKDAKEGKETPFIAYFDYEGSFSPDYMLAICKSVGFKGDLTDLFGIEDEEGNIVKIGVVRRYQTQVAEKFFNLQRKLQKMLPEKQYRNGKWWKVYDKKKDNDHLKDKANSKLLKETGQYWIECENGDPQAILVVDSYPAMLPKDIDEIADDKGEGLAAQARMFSSQLKRVKGNMVPKRVIVMGINQLRSVPMAMYGPSEAEPCGQALQFYSDARLKMTSRSSVFGNKGKIEEEPSVTSKGKDIYRYVNVKTHKNKLSVPDLETYLRLWVRDGEGNAHGYDPVFDSWQFMRMTGVMTSTETKSKITLYLDKIGVKDWPKKPKQITFLDLKRLIIGDKDDIKKTFKAIGYKGKPFYLRKKLGAYMESGQAVKDFFEQMKGTNND